MGQGLKVGLRGWHALGVLAAVLVWPQTGSAEALTLTAILSDFAPAEPEASDEAGATSLLVRSMLREQSRRFVPRQDWSSAVTDGKPSRTELNVQAEDAPALMKKMMSDRLLRGQLAKHTDRLVVDFEVLAADGTKLAKGSAAAPRGHVFELARQIAREAAPALQAEFHEVPPRSLHHLWPVVMAQRLMNQGRVTEAAHTLELAAPAFVATLPAAEELAQLIWRSPAATAADRMLTALALGDGTAVRTFADKALKADAKDVPARAARVRALLRLGELSAAERELRTVDKTPAEPAVAVARAEYALAAKADEDSRSAALRPLLSQSPQMWRPVLAFVAATEPGSFGSVMEAEFVAKAAALKKQTPTLASSIGVRALRAEVAPKEAFGLLTSDHLGAPEEQLLAAATSTWSAKGIADATRLRDELGRRSQAAELLRQEHAGTARPAANPRLVSGLAPLLERFANLNGRSFRTIALVPLQGSGQPVYAPFAVRAEVLSEGLAAALAAPPRALAVSEAAASSLDDDTPALELCRKLGRTLGSDALMLYRVRAEGRNAHVWLTLIDAVTGEAWRADASLPGAETGLVALHRTPVAIALALLVVGGLCFWRRWMCGAIVVQLREDPGVEEPLLCVRLSKDRTPPAIGNPLRFVARMRDAAPKHERYAATHVGSRISFARLPRGTWHVHVYGTFKRGGDLQVAVGEAFSRSVVVAPRRTCQVMFALDAAFARFSVLVADQDNPVSGVKVWLDEDDTSATTTGSDGCAELDVPRGRHVIHASINGQNVARPYDVQHIKLHEVRINLDWERKRDNASRVVVPARQSTASDVRAPTAVEGQLPTAPAALAFASPPVPALPTHRRAAAYAPMAAVSFDTEAPARDEITLGEMLGRLDNVPLAPTPQSSEVAGRYQKLSQLGAGAMGIVYKAHDKVLDREVALKIMSPDIRDNPIVAEKFIQEAKSLARLNHPNIVTVYDQGKDEHGELYMVMELVDGGALDELLTKRTKLPLALALDLVDQLAAGIGYAHSRRIIHRDIKPANMFVSQEGHLKVGDFGLARAVAAAKITKTRIQGTPLYMSPEQILGRDVDFRADLYSIGCTFFELLVGQPPFIEGEVLYHHMHTPPPAPSSFDPALPRQIDALVLLCLAKDKHERIESAEALRQGLKSIRAALS